LNSLLKREMNRALVLFLCSLLVPIYGQAPDQLPLDCGSVVYSAAVNPIQCVRLSRTALGLPDLEAHDDWSTYSQLSQTSDNQRLDGVFNDLWINGENPDSNTDPLQAGSEFSPYSFNDLPGACRWDLERSNKLGPTEACLCPASEATCTLNRERCYWYAMPEPMDDDIPTFKCINSAERFYLLLSRLLSKRGKKDFAIKIRYGATPARGKLPLGPYGPAIIGGGGGKQAAMEQAMRRLNRHLGSALPGFGGLGGGISSAPTFNHNSYGMSPPMPPPYGLPPPPMGYPMPPPPHGYPMPPPSDQYPPQPPPGYPLPPSSEQYPSPPTSGFPPHPSSSGVQQPFK